MKNLLYLLFLFSTQFAFAQSELPEGFGDYRTIENAEPGKVYTQAYIPPTFKTIVWRDSILLLNNNRHLLTNLTEGKDYDIITEVVEIRPAYTIWEFEEPKIDTIWETKTIVVDRICEEVEPMPKFENQVIIERQKMFDWSFKFVPYELTELHICECASSAFVTEPNAIMIAYAMIEIPSRYVSIEKQVFQKDGKWWTETIADTFYNRRLRYLAKEIKNSLKYIPAIIDTLEKIIVYEDILNQLVNPIFSTIEIKKIDKSDYFKPWREVLCAKSHYARFDKKIQKALIDKGYDLYEHGAFDCRTQFALKQFLKDNNLSIKWWNFDALYEVLKIEKE